MAYYLKVTKVIKDLESNSGETNISFANEKIGEDGLALFLEFVDTRYPIMVLNLSWNNIGAEGAAKLAGWLAKSTTITSLDLSNNDIGNEGAIAIAEALKQNDSLEGISLESNRIGNAGAIAISEALRKDAKLSYIYLGGEAKGNTFGDDGMISISLALAGNTTLQWLGIKNNKAITNKSVPALRYLLKNSMITSFDCEGTSISAASKRELIGLSRIIEERRKISPVALGFKESLLAVPTVSAMTTDDLKSEAPSESGSLDSSWSFVDGNATGAAAATSSDSGAASPMPGTGASASAVSTAPVNGDKDQCIVA